MPIVIIKMTRPLNFIWPVDSGGDLMTIWCKSNGCTKMTGNHCSNQDRTDMNQLQNRTDMNQLRAVMLKKLNLKKRIQVVLMSVAVWLCICLGQFGLVEFYDNTGSKIVGSFGQKNIIPCVK